MRIMRASAATKVDGAAVPRELPARTRLDFSSLSNLLKLRCNFVSSCGTVAHRDRSSAGGIFPVLARKRQRAALLVRTARTRRRLRCRALRSVSAAARTKVVWISEYRVGILPAGLGISGAHLPCHALGNVAILNATQVRLAGGPHPFHRLARNNFGPENGHVEVHRPTHATAWMHCWHETNSPRPCPSLRFPQTLVKCARSGPTRRWSRSEARPPCRGPGVGECDCGGWEHESFRKRVVMDQLGRKTLQAARGGVVICNTQAGHLKDEYARWFGEEKASACRCFGRIGDVCIGVGWRRCVRLQPWIHGGWVSASCGLAMNPVHGPCSVGSIQTQKRPRARTQRRGGAGGKGGP